MFLPRKKLIKAISFRAVFKYCKWHIEKIVDFCYGGIIKIDMRENILQKNNEPHDDRWHYLDSRNEKHTENYVEWKYFNFIQKDIAGYIVYYILDPEKKTEFGGGRLLVRILKTAYSMV